MIGVIVSFLFLLVGCTNENEPAITSTGTFGSPIPLQSFGELLVVEASVDGTEDRYFLVDTGAQYVLLDPVYAGELGYPSGPTPLGELTIGAITFHGVEAIPWDLDSFSSVLGVSLSGVLGASLFQHVTFMVDTQRLEARFLDGHEETLGFIDEGQVDGDAKVAPVTLIYGLALVDSIVEEELSAQMVLDTGASTTILFRSSFDELSSPTRPVLDGLQGIGAAGLFDFSFSRLCGFDIGEAGLDDLHIGVIPDEALGDAAVLLPEMRGLVGSSFFREYLTVFDLPAGEARFYRYHDRAHVPTSEWVQIGLTLDRASTGAIFVETIFEGTDAASRDINIGDEVLSIDGVPLADLVADDIVAALEGEPGDLRTLELTGSPDSRFVDVLVEDLLPPCRD